MAVGTEIWLVISSRQLLFAALHNGELLECYTNPENNYCKVLWNVLSNCGFNIQMCQLKMCRMNLFFGKLLLLLKVESIFSSMVVNFSICWKILWKFFLKQMIKSKILVSSWLNYNCYLSWCLEKLETSLCIF